MSPVAVQWADEGSGVGYVAGGGKTAGGAAIEVVAGRSKRTATVDRGIMRDEAIL